MKYLRAFLCALGMILAISVTSLNVYADLKMGLIRVITFISTKQSLLKTSMQN